MVRSQTNIIARYAETDQMGVVHHSVYPIWYEVARTDWIKQFGLRYSEMEKMGIMLPLSSLACRYLAPAYYEDELVVEAFLKKLTPFQVEFGYEVYRQGTLISAGETHHGWTDLELRPTPLKRSHPDLFAKLQEQIETNGIK